LRATSVVSLPLQILLHYHYYICFLFYAWHILVCVSVRVCMLSAYIYTRMVIPTITCVSSPRA
jgi:hypothetical protein